MKELNSSLIDKSITERKSFINSVNLNRRLSNKMLIKAPNLSMVSKFKNLKNKKSSMQNSLKDRANEIALLSKDVSEKYQIKEQDVYDKVYLKVRKLFLEAL